MSRRVHRRAVQRVTAVSAPNSALRLYPRRAWHRAARAPSPRSRAAEHVRPPRRRRRSNIRMVGDRASQPPTDRAPARIRGRPSHLPISGERARTSEDRPLTPACAGLLRPVRGEGAPAWPSGQTFAAKIGNSPAQGRPAGSPAPFSARTPAISEEHRATPLARPGDSVRRCPGLRHDRAVGNFSTRSVPGARLRRGPPPCAATSPTTWRRRSAAPARPSSGLGPRSTGSPQSEHWRPSPRHRGPCTRSRGIAAVTGDDTESP